MLKIIILYYLITLYIYSNIYKKKITKLSILLKLLENIIQM